jgi:hypothetical protein
MTTRRTDLQARVVSLERAVVRLASLEFGDKPGHPFRGNQYDGGAGAVDTVMGDSSGDYVDDGSSSPARAAWGWSNGEVGAREAVADAWEGRGTGSASALASQLRAAPLNDRALERGLALTASQAAALTPGSQHEFPPAGFSAAGGSATGWATSNLDAERTVPVVLEVAPGSAHALNLSTLGVAAGQSSEGEVIVASDVPLRVVGVSEGLDGERRVQLAR